MKIKLTDFAGQPFVGSTVVAIYDKSLEYISGGSNVPDIKEFFWKWRRQHNPTESSLGRWFGNLVRPNAPAMGDLGVFGGSVADDPMRPPMRANGGDASPMGGVGSGGMGGMGSRGEAVASGRRRRAHGDGRAGADGADAAPAAARCQWQTPLWRRR